MGKIGKLFCAFLLIYFVHNHAFSENIEHYFKGGYYELYKPNVPKTFEVKLEVGELKKYIKNLVGAYARGTDLIQKYKRKYSGYIIVDNKDNKTYKAKINITGDHLDHIMPEMKPISSLSVNMTEGNLGGITRFRLLLPGTRHGITEIFTAALFKTLGFPTLHEQIVTIKFNNHTYDVIFQEKPEKEFLERHGIRETAILEGNEIQWWYNIANKKQNYPQVGPFIEGYKVDNSNFLKNELSSLIASNGISYLNLNQNVINKKGRPIKNVINEYLFRASLSSFNASHGEVWHNRKYIFIPYMNYLIPIYYDGMGNSMMNTEYINNLTINENYDDVKAINDIIGHYKSYIKLYSGPWWRNYKTQKHLAHNIETKSLYKLFLHALQTSKFTDAKYNLINENTFNDISKQEYTDVISLYINNGYVNNIVFMQNNNFLHCISHNLVLYDNSIQNKCNRIDYSIYNNYISGKAKPIKNNIDESLLDIFPNYIGHYPPLFSNKDIKFYENYSNDIIEIKSNEIIYLKYRNAVNLDSLNILLHQDGYDVGHAVILGELPGGMKINVESGVYKSISRVHTSRYNEILLTGCLSFIETKFNNNSITFNNLPCEDGINILNSSGHIKNITGGTFSFDGLDIDFSELTIEELHIHNSNNDCVDLSSGIYTVDNIVVSNCKDKGISVGEASELISNNVEINKSNIGVASKDSSKVYINSATILNTDNCYLNYNKKQEFNTGEIEIRTLDGC